MIQNAAFLLTFTRLVLALRRRASRGLWHRMAWTTRLTFTTLFIFTCKVHAQDAILLGGGPPDQQERPLAQSLPRGPIRQLVTGPLQSQLQSSEQLFVQRCSFRFSICVYSTATQENIKKRIPLALQLLEQAYERAVFGSRMLGFSAAVDAQLLWDISSSGVLKTQGFSSFSPSFDRGRFICRSGELSREDASLCMSEALLHSQAPGTQPELRHGFALYASTALSDTTTSLRQSMALGQAASEAGILDQANRFLPPPVVARGSKVISQGAGTAALLAHFFGKNLGRAFEFETVYLAHLMAVSSSDGYEYLAEPDLFDIYRNSISTKAREIGRFFGNFATARTFNSELRPGTQPRWQLKAKELPHNLILTRGLGSYGFTQLELDVTELPQGSSIGVRLYCEGPVSYQFTIVRLDQDKHEISRFIFPFREGVHTFSQKIEFSTATKYLRLVGTSLGGIGSAYPFDPDQGPFRRRRCGIYLTP